MISKKKHTFLPYTASSGALRFEIFTTVFGNFYHTAAVQDGRTAEDFGHRGLYTTAFFFSFAYQVSETTDTGEETGPDPETRAETSQTWLPHWASWTRGASRRPHNFARREGEKKSTKTSKKSLALPVSKFFVRTLR
jgi:hypothetical protein